MCPPCALPRRHDRFERVHAHMAKEANSCGKRGLFMWKKRPIRMAKEAFSYGKRGLFMWQKRPNLPRRHDRFERVHGRHAACHPCGIYVCMRRRQKRPIHILYGKRGLLSVSMGVTLPVTPEVSAVPKQTYSQAKEAYSCGKRGQSICWHT